MYYLSLLIANKIWSFRLYFDIIFTRGRLEGARESKCQCNLLGHFEPSASECGSLNHSSLSANQELRIYICHAWSPRQPTWLQLGSSDQRPQLVHWPQVYGSRRLFLHRLINIYLFLFLFYYPASEQTSYHCTCSDILLAQIGGSSSSISQTSLLGQRHTHT